MLRTTTFFGPQALLFLLFAGRGRYHTSDFSLLLEQLLFFVLQTVGSASKFNRLRLN